MASIEINHLRVDFGQTRALRGVSLTVNAGEVFALIGPNGAGKTTLMRALMGLVVPTAGTIQVNGIDPLAPKTSGLGQVGFMPDFPPMQGDLSAWHWLDFFGGLYNLPKPARSLRMEELLGTVGLLPKRHEPLGNLSRGMKQRLMLAKTLLPRPSILLLDEPASGMDPDGRLILKRLIQDAAREGCCVIVSSHVLAELEEFATALGIMEKGQFVVAGTRQEVAEKLHAATALRVRWKGNPEIAFRAFASHGLAPRLPLTLKDDGVFHTDTIAMTLDEKSIAALLKDLIHGGLEVSSLTHEGGSLEQLFVQTGAKTLS